MKRFSLLALAGLLALALVVPATTAAAPSNGAALLNDVVVTGTDSAGNAFAGTLDITRIARTGGSLVFDGTLTNAATGAVTTFTGVTGTLVNGGGASCDILFLDLGPISLDLLGLTVDLSRITLDVNAVPGAGNLLGNLLCSVAGLLDGGLLGGGLSQLLNQLLALINGILA